MAPVTIKPVRLTGPWADGYVLDRQTVRSIPTGDPYHPFDTERTELGELLYQFKYHNKADTLPTIVDTAEDFIRNRWQLPRLDCIVPAPPSVKRGERTQPVLALAAELASRLKIPTCENAVMKVKPTKEMKNIGDWEERRKVLSEAIQRGEGDVRNKCILLFDDLTQSGSTLSRVTEVLLSDGGASAVFVLVLTRTK